MDSRVKDFASIVNHIKHLLETYPSSDDESLRQAADTLKDTPYPRILSEDVVDTLSNSRLSNIITLAHLGISPESRVASPASKSKENSFATDTSSVKSVKNHVTRSRQSSSKSSNQLKRRTSAALDVKWVLADEKCTLCAHRDVDCLVDQSGHIRRCSYCVRMHKRCSFADQTEKENRKRRTTPEASPSQSMSELSNVTLVNEDLDSVNHKDEPMTLANTTNTMMIAEEIVQTPLTMSWLIDTEDAIKKDWEKVKNHYAQRKKTIRKLTDRV